MASAASHASTRGRTVSSTNRRTAACRSSGVCGAKAAATVADVARRLLVTAVAAQLGAAVLTSCQADDVIADQCLREAERIQAPTARAAAEEGCRAASDGGVSAEDAERAARRRCLQATERIANEQAR